VIHPLARSWLQRVLACDESARGGSKRKQNRLFQRLGPNVSSEGLAIYEHVHTTRFFIWYDSHLVPSLVLGSAYDPNARDQE